MKLLVTCPPMLGMKDQFIPQLEALGIEAYCPDVVQTLSVEELIDLVPNYDGWIIGDDPATREVFEAGLKGKLKAAVKWGIGVDNVDLAACKDLGIPIINTPNMFGAEVADVAMGYIIGLARETFYIDRMVREGRWPKNRGISLQNKTVGLVGYGDIGQNTEVRVAAAGMNVIAYDPAFSGLDDTSKCSFVAWPQRLNECDFVVFTCSLNEANHHMLNQETLGLCMSGVRIVNVARGPLIDESALLEALSSGHVHSAALDVFEQEPLSEQSGLRDYPLCIFGSHNGSNSEDAVIRTNNRAIAELCNFLGVDLPSSDES
ncbi:MAG: D-3-phosphoglycerate dehydrogenase [Flavobacterium sp.]|jgi:D-3-phosphoglycerate dehydrogenase